MGDLKGMGFDLGLTGFGELELEQAARRATDGDGDPDEAPEPPAEPVSRPGDLWICGEHRVLCGDATVRPTSTSCWTASWPTWLFAIHHTT